MSRTVKEEDAEVAQRAAEVSLQDAAKYRARILGLAPSECIMLEFIGSPLQLSLWYSMFVFIGTTTTPQYEIILVFLFSSKFSGGETSQ